MKLTKEQLRRIIREAVKVKLEALKEAPEGALEAGPADAVAGALVTQMIETFDHTFASNVHEMMVSVTGDDFMRPGRYEDVEHFATQAVEQALSDPELKDALVTVAMDVMRSAMEPG